MPTPTHASPTHASPTHSELHPDADAHKGAVEDDQPHSGNQTSMTGQLGHRTNHPQETASEHQANESIDDQIKDGDSDFPEPGSSPEHSGQHR